MHSLELFIALSCQKWVEDIRMPHSKYRKAWYYIRSFCAPRLIREHGFKKHCYAWLDEVLRRLHSDNNEPEEDLSVDGEDLVGDFVDESGRPGLFSNGMNGASL